ncbi:DUF1015 family protein [Streptomyces sp. NPDC004267]|uniref:DUF1015 family protein n=1 Tax=Streptomyces sp. NPDC004267 TaxID=3364694 RepID=UPI00369BBEB6
MDLIPFRATRFVQDVVGDLASVTALPEEHPKDGGRPAGPVSPYNVRQIIQPDADTSAEAARNAGARVTLRRWLSEGVLATDAEPALYVYDQTEAGTVIQRGLIGALKVSDDPSSGVLPHEEHFAASIPDRADSMRTASANMEPIFCVYQGGGAASELVDEVADGRRPMVRVTTEDGRTHRLWRITEESAHAAIAADLRDRAALIADGHHRYAAYQRLRAEHAEDEAWHYGLALLVDSAVYPPRLRAIHRVLPGLPFPEAVERAKSVCRVQETPREFESALRVLESTTGDGISFLISDGDRHFLMQDVDRLAIERAMSGATPREWRNLDSAILHHVFIELVWDHSGESDIAYVHGAREAVDQARRNNGTAVVLRPPDFSDVRAIAMAGGRVPYKSTSFDPKPRSGFVLRVLGEPPTEERSDG